ncbi:MAG: glycosyltransferase family 4 protein [Victivallales bacterium]|nr:glycosyltransferase family 4 protein [Victivallales bacterium]
MHFLLALKTYDDADAVLDVCQLAILALKQGHHVTLLTFESAPPSGCPRAVKVITCPRAFFSPVRHWLFQRAFDQARSSGEYDASFAFVPVKGADIYLPRRFVAPPSLLDFFRRPPSLLWRTCHTQLFSSFTYVTKSQGLTLQEKGCVPQARLLQIDPEFHEECLQRPDQRSQHELRREFNFSEKHILVLQVADDWHRQGVDRSLAALGGLHPSIGAVCYYLLISRHSSQRKLESLAERQGFSPAHVINLGNSRPLSQMLAIADILLHPAREEEAGTMLIDALTAGIPVVCTDNCGYSIFLHRTCCPVIPAPYHLAAVTDALSFAMLHLGTFKKLIPAEFERLGLRRRAAQLLHALENHHKLLVGALPTTDVIEIVALHLKNLEDNQALKNEHKRTASRVTYQGVRYIVKEFRRRNWWRPESRSKRTEHGTALLARYTPQVCGKYHDNNSGSDYLVFHDCGDGNFFQADYAKRPDAPQLYSTCGRLLAELHDANIYHHDTKPANFVRNEFCQGECALDVCLVDCDNVTRSLLPISVQTRAHNLAQFIAGTGKVARLDRDLWRSLINAFFKGYGETALLPAGELDQLCNRTWQIVESQKHIEYTLPEDFLDEATQVTIQ